MQYWGEINQPSKILVWVWMGMVLPSDIGNILSLSHRKEKFRVAFDSTIDNCFHVHKKERENTKIW